MADVIIPKPKGTRKGRGQWNQKRLELDGEGHPTAPVAFDPTHHSPASHQSPAIASHWPNTTKGQRPQEHTDVIHVNGFPTKQTRVEDGYPEGQAGNIQQKDRKQKASEERRVIRKWGY